MKEQGCGQGAEWGLGTGGEMHGPLEVESRAGVLQVWYLLGSIALHE